MDHILSEKGRIDVLVNNAGYGLMVPVEDASMAAIKNQFDVNVFACTHLMQLVTPAMRAQGSGIIINMSSVVGHLSMPLLGFYAGSKHALEAISDAARNELYPQGIDVVLIEPGAIRTEFEDVAFNALQQSVKTEQYKPLAKRLESLSNLKYKRAPGPEAVANVVHKIVTSSKPKKRYKVGLDAHFMIPLKNILGDGFIDPILRFLLRLNKRP
jgi:short-subunit dehydrogenase